MFLLGGIVGFCGMAAEGAMSDWSGLYLIDVVGTPSNIAPIGLAAYMVTMASGRFLIDKATQKWGGRKRVLQAGGTLITIGLFSAVALPHFITTIIAFMIIGFGTAGIVPSIYSVAGQRTKISTSIALTIVSSVSFLGFLMGASAHRLYIQCHQFKIFLCADRLIRHLHCCTGITDKNS